MFDVRVPSEDAGQAFSESRKMKSGMWTGMVSIFENVVVLFFGILLNFFDTAE
jgi:hypothetical protein